VGDRHPLRAAPWWALPIAAGILAVLLGADAPPSPSPLVPDLTPVIRVEVPSGATATGSVRLASPGPLTILAADTDCACLAVDLALPYRHGGGDLTVPVRVTGVRDGAKLLTLRTTAGTLTATVQVVVAGSGTGADSLARIRARAQEVQAATVAVLVHDLMGAVRNCGCSDGSLGGIDHLAALPAAWVLAGGPPAVWALTGDADGHRTGVAAALQAVGWTRTAPAGLQVTADPRAPQRSTILPAIGRQGMVAWAVLLDATGRPVERHLLPIDRTLPTAPAILAGFREPPVHPGPITPDEAVASCAGCHPAATTVWHASGHARPWAGLPESDRTAGCVDCHSQPAPAGLVPAVTCQSCHPGSDAHARSGGTQAPPPAADCRTCHDSKHHPGFDRASAWPRVAH
jgi:hypothetical protein